MSNPDDTLLADDPAAALETPPPVPVEVAPPQERSGAISVSGGDFSTPMVRKRTITRPRGLPAVAPVVDLAANVVTPPPELNGARKSGAEVDAAAPVAPLDGVESSVNTLHSQASRLRNERILDVPDADVATPLPPPPSIEAEAEAEPEATIPPIDVDPGPTPPPEIAAAPALVAESAPAAEVASEAAVAPAAAASSEAAVAPAAAASSEAAVAPAAEPASPIPEADTGAIPAQQMRDSDSERNISPLAQTLAHIAEAQLHTDGSLPDDVASGDDLELVDAPLETVPAIPAPKPVLPPLPVIPAAAFKTPPPIPANLAKAANAMSAIASAGVDSGAVESRAAAPAFPPLPEALAERPRRPKRSKPWFEEIFDEDYLRTLPFMTPEQTLREVSFIEASLEAPAGAEILDVGCGYGRHAIELVQRGLNVTGLDLSLPLLIRAADEAQRRSLSVNFVHADMREMPFDRKFDGAYCMLTSFGYFDEDANLRVAEGVARALKPGGRFLLDIVNRDYLVADLPTRIWWEGVGCVVLEEVDFNFHTSRIVTRRSVVFEDGRQLEQEISVRAYSLHEVGRLLRQAGFRVLDISGSMATRGRFFGGSSRGLLVLSEKRTD